MADTMPLIDFFAQANYANAPIITEYLADAPLVMQLSPETNIMNHMVTYIRDKSNSEDSGRNVNGDPTTSEDDTDFEYITKKLIIRNKTITIDRYIATSQISVKLRNLKTMKALRSLGSGLNNRIINALGNNQTFRGLKYITEDNGNISSYGTLVTNQATASAFIDYLENAQLAINYKGKAIWCGNELLKVFRKVGEYTQQVSILPDEKRVGRAVGAILLGGTAVPIIWAGKIGAGTSYNSEVIPLDTTTSDLYIVDTAPDALTLALEWAPVDEIKIEKGTKFIFEQYQMLCDKSVSCAFKHTQKVA